MHVVLVLCVDAGLHIVLIGLGGGGLPMFLRLNIPNVLSHSVFCSSIKLVFILKILALLLITVHPVATDWYCFCPSFISLCAR